MTCTINWMNRWQWTCVSAKILVGERLEQGPQNMIACCYLLVSERIILTLHPRASKLWTAPMSMPLSGPRCVAVAFTWLSYSTSHIWLWLLRAADHFPAASVRSSVNRRKISSQVSCCILLTCGALALTHSIVAANAVVVGGADGRAILVVALRTRFEGIEHLRVEVDDLELRVQRTATSGGQLQSGDVGRRWIYSSATAVCSHNSSSSFKHWLIYILTYTHKVSDVRTYLHTSYIC